MYCAVEIPNVAFWRAVYNSSYVCLTIKMKCCKYTFNVRDQFIESFFGIVVNASTQVVRQLIKVVLGSSSPWYLIILSSFSFISKRSNIVDSENVFCWLASNDFISASVIARWNSWSSSMLLKGKKCFHYIFCNSKVLRHKRIGYNSCERSNGSNCNV